MARCPVCHEAHEVNPQGFMMRHERGSGTCSGSGRMAPLHKHDKAQVKAAVYALAQFILLADTTQGVVLPATDRYSPPDHKQWGDYGFIESARVALFNICQSRPELLEGTNLTIGMLTPQSAPACLIEGPAPYVRHCHLCGIELGSNEGMDILDDDGRATGTYCCVPACC